MNTFAFNPKEKFEKQYAYLLRQIKHNDQMWDLIKVWWLVVLLVFFAFVYLYFVSLSSTRGYFLRQAMQERTSISFQQEIIKTNILKVRQENWESMKEVTIQWWRPTQSNVVKIQLPNPSQEIIEEIN
jgi:hypothetical protein